MKRENIIVSLLLLPSVLVILVLAFYWSVIDLVTPFLMEPIEKGVWFLLFTSTIISGVLLFKKDRARKLKSYLPIMAFIGTLLCAEFVPFTSIWLDLNFRVHRVAREKIAADVLSGKLLPNVSYNHSLIALPSGYEGLSAGGGQVFIETFEKNSGVYFYTYRGILGSSSGYMYMSSDVVPNGSDIVDMRKVAPHWFFIRTM